MPIYLLTDDIVFPPVHLATPEGLLAVGGDLSPRRLLLAYQCGIFPWYSDDDPILWWSPDPRLVLYLSELKVSHSLKRTIRKARYKITMDTHFQQVIESCAQTRSKSRQGTWITTEMVHAYTRLHKMGIAHSVETWHQDEIVGGLYGVSLGRCFFGESMFSTMTDASKVALVYLRDYLQDRKFDIVDCQLPTDHLIRMGARKITRSAFISQLNLSLRHSTLKGPWHIA
jgi:leucyl/phenylalanyl-tRNA--protein transferase